LPNTLSKETALTAILYFVLLFNFVRPITGPRTAFQVDASFEGLTILYSYVNGGSDKSSSELVNRVADLEDGVTSVVFMIGKGLLGAIILDIL
jgi:hypothetical protein